MAADQSTPAASRRALLAAAPAALLLPSVSVGAPRAVLAPSDADLLALHGAARRAFQAYEVSVNSVAHLRPSEEPARQVQARAEQGAAWAAYEAALEAMAETPAGGLAGLAAKLGATTAFDADFLDPDDAEQVVLASAADDAARMLSALGLPALAPPPPRDARLLVLAEQWAALTDEIDELFEAAADLPLGDPRGRGALAQEATLAQRRRDVLAEIADAPATSPAGRRAKARILGGYLDGRDDPVAALAASLVRDLVGGGAA